MSGLSPETRALLELGREEDEPTPEDLARVRRALVVKIGVGAVAGVVGTAVTSRAAASVPSLLGLGASKGMTVAVSVLVGGAVSTGVVLTTEHFQHTAASGAATVRAQPARRPPSDSEVAAAWPDAFARSDGRRRDRAALESSLEAARLGKERCVRRPDDQPSDRATIGRASPGVDSAAPKSAGGHEHFRGVEPPTECATRIAHRARAGRARLAGAARSKIPDRRPQGGAGSLDGVGSVQSRQAGRRV